MSGSLYRHLAQYFAAAYPELCTMVVVPGAEEFSSTIAIARAADPLRAAAALGFSVFFLRAAREIYPHYGFAPTNEAEYGAIIRSDD